MHLVRRPKFAVSALLTLALTAAIGTVTALAVCLSNTNYTVTSSAPPPLGNWTDTTGAVWSPAGGFPGCATGDTAADTNISPTTLIINSAIPNPIVGLNLACTGCTIDIQSGGSLALAGNGSIAATTTIVVEPGGTLLLQNGANLTVQNAASLSVNGGFVDVQNGAQLTLNGASTVTNGGTLSVSGGTMTVNNTLTVQSSGQLNLAGATVNGSGTLNNNGTVLQTGAPSTLGCVFNNQSGGNAGVQSGTLSIAGGGTGDAPFVLDPGAVLDFTASYNLTANGTVSGGGTLQVDGGTLSIGGVTSPGNFTIDGGTLTGAGFLSVAGTFTWNGGTLTGSGGTEIAGGGTGNFTGANGAMTLDGRAFNDYGYVNYNVANPLTLVNSAAFGVYGTFDIQDDGGVTSDGTGSFAVAPNGLLMKTGGSGVSTISAPFSNSATVWGLSGTLELSGSGAHSGSFYAGSGATLAFDAGSATFSGSINADGTISFQGGSSVVTGSYSVNGLTAATGGNVSIANGTTQNLLLDGAVFGVGSSFTLNGSGTWSSGTLDGGGTFDVGSSATLTIDAANGNADLDGGTTLQNDGTVHYTAANPPGNRLSLSGASAIQNNALFDISGDQPISNAIVIVGSGKPPATKSASQPKHGGAAPHLVAGSPAIHNAGTFQKTGSGGTTDIDPDFDTTGTVLAQNGTLHFIGQFTQNAGTTTLGPGNITCDLPMTIEDGTVNGSGTITGDLDSDGIVAPGSPSTTGTINVTGNYTQWSPGTLYIKLASAASYDQLVVGGAASLDGTFTATLVSPYVPANGTTWPVLTFASRSGDFATYNLPTPPNGSINASYTPTQLILTASIAAQADLQITKTGPAGVTAGSNVTYTVTVTNAGPDAASSVVVSDPTPANLTFVSNSGACTGPYPCSLGTLTSGQSATITSTYSTSGAFSGNVTNTASVSSTTLDGNNSNNSASATTNVGAQADLSVVKTGPASVVPGQTYTYTIAFSNAGPSPATSVVINDPTPVGVAFVSNTGACTTPFPCSLGTLNSGQGGTITSTFTVPANYSGVTITNTATISSSVNDPNAGDNTSAATTNVTQQTDLAITKSGPAAATPGQPVVYQIVVSNLGPSAAGGVTVTDATPAGLTFVSNSGACTTPFPCSLGALNAGQSATITSTFLVPANYAGTSIVNTASVSSAGTDPNSTNDSSSVTTPVTAQADVGITKSGPATTAPGQNVVYTVTVTNNGPLAAANVFVNDPTPAGLTFVSNSGACSGTYPCALGTLASGQSATITSTYAVPSSFGGTTITNVATVSSSTPDANGANNTAVATTSLSGTLTADLAVTKSGPSVALPHGSATFHIQVYNAGPNAAANVVVSDATPAGLTFTSNSGACTTPFPCNVGTLAPGQTATIDAHYSVGTQVRGSFSNTASASSAATDPNPSNNSSTILVRTQQPPACPTSGPQLLSPANNATIPAPAVLSWSAVPNAISYTVLLSGSGAPAPVTTSSTTVNVPLPAGAFTWSVVANGPNGCQAVGTNPRAFTICGVPAAPLASVVGEATTGQTYSVSWPAVDGAVKYELQEAPSAAFTNPTSTTVLGTSQSFTKNATAATPFFYRVRALGACGDTGPFSLPVSVVVIPVPPPSENGGSINVPAGSTQPVTFKIFIPGLPGVTTTFLATVDKPWLAVAPTSGFIGPDGITLTITADPSSLTNGTWTGTVLVVYGSSTITGRVGTNGSTTTAAVPVSINLVTPVTPGALPKLSASAVVIPTVGHLAGASSDWRSDIRVANTGAAPQRYQVLFNPGTGDPAVPVKQTTITTDAGATVALDDIVRNWFGTGSLGDSATGSLIVQPADSGGSVSVSKVAVVTSRTYNSSAAGTLGQYVPAVPFAAFLGAGGGALSLQQIAQSGAYHTNLGVVEANGKAAAVQVSAFDGAGAKLLDFPLSLKAGEQRQLDNFLAASGITLSNGHIEVTPLSGDGKITAYASVVDSRNGAPILVPAVTLGGSGNSRFVLPGIADLGTALASWRSDVRILNGGSAPQSATLTFYPLGNGAPSTQSVTVNPGETAALDDVLHSLFGITNAGGTLHVTTASNAPLVVSARTYDQTSAGGTLGQFIPAAIPFRDDAGSGERALQLVQVEDSARFRTNVGIVETSGNPATVEVSVILPDSKVSPKVQLSLAPFESKQFPIIASLGLGATYNARVSIRVIDGTGRITAYASVIDQATEAPTFVPAQ